MEQQTKPRRRLPKAGRKEVTTRMLPEMAEAIRQAADKRGVTVNDFIVEAVRAELVRSAIQNGEVHFRVQQALTVALAELLDHEVAISA